MADWGWCKRGWRVGAAAALLSALALGFSSAFAAEPGRSLEVRIAARVLSYVKITSRLDPAFLEVTPSDAARGYVDIDNATSLAAVTNAIGGYMVTAIGAPGLIANVAMRIDGVGSGERVHVASRPFVNSPLRVGYRLHLEAGVAAGRYPWPVALSLSRE